MLSNSKLKLERTKKSKNTESSFKVEWNSDKQVDQSLQNVGSVSNNSSVIVNIIRIMAALISIYYSLNI